MKKQLSNKLAASAFGCAIVLALLPSGAAAQAMSPMRKQVTSFTDSFAVRVIPANPYDHRIRLEVRVYDQHFNPVEAMVSPAEFTLSARNSRPVYVVVPFVSGNNTRKVRICTEAVPFQGEARTTSIKAQVCGKFMGVRTQ